MENEIHSNPNIQSNQNGHNLGTEDPVDFYFNIYPSSGFNLNVDSNENCIQASMEDNFCSSFL